MTIAEKREVCFKEFDAQKSYVDARCDSDIEKFRKGDMLLVLKNKEGKPLLNETVEIHQTNHDFKYGANIFMLDEFGEAWENKAYRGFFSKHFNLATVPFYWSDLEPEKDKPRYSADSPKIYRRPAPDLCVDYCEKSGILPKLHCLFYDTFMPSWAPANDKNEMRRLYEKRFSEIASRYCGKMYEFEVTNETLCSSGWKKKSILSDERGIIEWCFALARKYFKDEKLVINEANPCPSIANEGYNSKYMLQLEMLLAKGTPIDKIGIQNHIFTGAGMPAGVGASDDEIRGSAASYMNPEKLFKALDKLGEFGLPLEITEVTVPTLGNDDDAELLQADLFEYMYKIWFSIPQMETVVYWNAVDNTAYCPAGSAWNENNCRGGLFHRDMTPKKSAMRLYDMFNKRWHTDMTLTTDENGCVKFRGFYGDYSLSVCGKAQTFGLHKNNADNIDIVI